MNILMILHNFFNEQKMTGAFVIRNTDLLTPMPVTVHTLGGMNSNAFVVYVYKDSVLVVLIHE
jgi:uncharacterized membrane protein (UPF0136 family)